MIIHVVSYGESLYSVAAYYGVSVLRLAYDNGLRADSPLVIGQALIVMLPSVTYTIKQGDSLTSIAENYGITANRLLQYNPSLINSDSLPVGTDITVKFRGEKAGSIETLGYAYPYINRNTLKTALTYLTYIAVFSYGFKDSGELIVPDDDEILRLASQYSTVPVMVLTTIGGNGGFSTEKATSLFYDADFRDKVLDNIIMTMINKGYKMLDVDFEYIAPEDKEAYIGFLRAAKEKLRRRGLMLSVDLAPKTYAEQPGLLYEAHDYERIGEIADQVLLMTYEWGYTYGPPMAVAPLNQVRYVIEYGVSEIDSDKIFMGIPNYGYDWTLPYEKGTSRAQSIGNQTAVQRALQNNTVIDFDSYAVSPYYYYEADQREHIVWFEDVRSIEGKLNLRDEFSLKGIGYWNVMRPFMQNYLYVASTYDIIKKT